MGIIVGLGPNSFWLAIGSNVIVRSNLWKPAGIFNGAKCVVREILYDKEANLNSLPICIFVEMENFKGNGFMGTNLIPIVPQVFPNRTKKTPK